MHCKNKYAAALEEGHWPNTYEMVAVLGEGEDVGHVGEQVVMVAYNWSRISISSNSFGKWVSALFDLRWHYSIII